MGSSKRKSAAAKPAAKTGSIEKSLNKIIRGDSVAAIRLAAELLDKPINSCPL